MRFPSKLLRGAAAAAFTLALGATAAPALAGDILFIGNSFTFGWGSPVRFYRANTVTDLNNQGIGGVPALFKSFTAQAGLNYGVYVETQPGVGVDWHLENKLGTIGQRPWDTVVMHGYSTLDPKVPGDPATLITTTKQMAEFIKSKNAKADVRLTATWSRPDQTYEPRGAWYGKAIDAMARDVRAGYDKAAANSPAITGVVPVGEAFTRAIQAGVADGNPYDGIDAGKLNLWTYDGYHASTAGYYLEALVVFGSVTGRDPRSLGDRECSGFELGLSQPQVGALQRVAFEQLAASGPITPAPLVAADKAEPNRCAAVR